jgi:hypothetical protein
MSGLPNKLSGLKNTARRTASAPAASPEVLEGEEDGHSLVDTPHPGRDPFRLHEVFNLELAGLPGCGDGFAGLDARPGTRIPIRFRTMLRYLPAAPHQGGPPGYREPRGPRLGTTVGTIRRLHRHPEPQQAPIGLDGNGRTHGPAGGALRGETKRVASFADTLSP